MHCHRTLTTMVLIAVCLSWTGSQASHAEPASTRSLQDSSWRTGISSTAESASSAEAASDQSPAADIQPIRYVTAKSLRQSDFAPILETSLFTSTDYSVYAWLHFSTGAASATIQLKWHWIKPDGTSFDSISPWWSFGSEGMAASWLEGPGIDDGRWQVKYYVQTSSSSSWQFLGENIFFVNPGLPCTQLITNGGFEAGSTGWDRTSNTYIGDGKAHWGSQSAWLGGADSSYYYLYQDVALPSASAGELALAYFYNLYTTEGMGTSYDFFDIQLRDTAGNVLETLDTIGNDQYYYRSPLDVWQPTTWDLSAYAGQTVRIWMQASTDLSLPTTWYLDDFSVTKCATSVSLNVDVILAEPSDETHSASHDRAYYESLFQLVRSYHIENTLGYVTLNLGDVYDNGGSWYKLSKTHKDYAAASLDFVREAEQSALGTTDIPRDTILVVVHAGEASQTRTQGDGDEYISTATWEPPDSPNGNELVVSENDLVGLWAHEIGHDLGSLLVNSVTPDIYLMGNVGKWDLMASGSWNGGWLEAIVGLLGRDSSGDGSNPPHMSSYTKEFLQLLRYDQVSGGTSGSYWIDVLPRQQLRDKALQYVMTRRDDGTPNTYYLLETRNPSKTYSRWDTSAPEAGLVLYWVDTKNQPKYGNWGSKTSQTINLVKVLDPPGLFHDTKYFDADNLIDFEVVEQSSAGTSYALKVDISTPAPDPIWLAGVILRPAGGVASDVAAWRPIAAPPVDGITGPDLDLHVYTDDGRHVGMNYVTGQYEMQVDGALASSNLLNAHEWILLPQGIPFHYIVRSTSTSKFLEENPNLATHTDGQDAYEVYGLISDPAQGFSTSPLQQVSIASGVDFEHSVSASSGSPSIQIGLPVARILPVDLTVAAAAPALVAPDESITYVLKFGNSGGTGATNINLEIEQPTNTDLVSAPGFTMIGANKYQYSVAAMGIAESSQATFTVRVRAGTPVGTPLVMRASIADDATHGLDSVPGNNEVTLTSHASSQIWLPMISGGEE